MGLWIKNADGSIEKVAGSGGGGTFEGEHVITGDPTDPAMFDEVAVGQLLYDGVEDTGGGNGGIEEAPSDGKQYARQDESWSEVVGSGGGGPHDHSEYAAVEHAHDEFTHDHAEYLPLTGGTLTGPGNLQVDGEVGIGTASPKTPLGIVAANKLGSSFKGTIEGEGVRVAQSDYTAGNYVSLVESSYQDDWDSPSVRIGAMFDGGGSQLSFGTTNAYASGITNEALVITSQGDVRVTDDLTIASYAQRGLVIDRTANPNVQGLVELKPSYEAGVTTADIKVDDNVVARFRGDKFARLYGDAQVDGKITLRTGGGANSGNVAIGFDGIDNMGIYSSASGSGYMRFGVAGTQQFAIKDAEVVVNYNLRVDGTINGTLAFGIAEGIDTGDVLERAETATMPAPVDDEGVATADAEIITVNEVMTAMLAKIKELSAEIEELKKGA